LPPFWQTVTYFNPVLYLISGFRWSFYEVADVNLAISLGFIFIFLFACIAAIWWIFKTGYQIRS
ncbi:MAG: sugar ABC transporter permease, partial [Pseudomonadota bacterium]